MVGISCLYLELRKYNSFAIIRLYCDTGSSLKYESHGDIMTAGNELT